MKVYTVETVYDGRQVHCVVADTIASVEKIHKEKYPGVTIEKISLYSEYVLIQGDKD